MTDTEFRKLVSEMRHWQKEYFRTRSAFALEESKRHEKRVDEAMNDDKRQPRLFEG